MHLLCDPARISLPEGAFWRAGRNPNQGKTRNDKTQTPCLCIPCGVFAFQETIARIQVLLYTVADISNVITLPQSLHCHRHADITLFVSLAIILYRPFSLMQTLYGHAAILPSPMSPCHPTAQRQGLLGPLKRHGVTGYISGRLSGPVGVKGSEYTTSWMFCIVHF